MQAIATLDILYPPEIFHSPFGPLFPIPHVVDGVQSIHPPLEMHGVCQGFHYGSPIARAQRPKSLLTSRLVSAASKFRTGFSSL
jgi:hypothetical protein